MSTVTLLMKCFDFNQIKRKPPPMTIMETEMGVEKMVDDANTM